ncbi:MAG: hypothetical protein ACFFG0_39930 [Candidatus Thorarchaeota archaeon]
MSKRKIELNSSRIKFESILDLVDKAIDTGNQIHIPKNVISQKNNNMKLIRWLEKHKIISVSTIEKEIPKKISIRSRNRRIEISFQLYALNVPLNDIAKRFGVKLDTTKGYLKELNNYTNYYLKLLSIVLNIKKITPETDIANFPSFPIRLSLKILQEKLTLSEYEKLQENLMRDRNIKRITGQALGTFNLSLLLPKK